MTLPFSICVHAGACAQADLTGIILDGSQVDTMDHGFLIHAGCARQRWAYEQNPRSSKNLFQSYIFYPALIRLKPDSQANSRLRKTSEDLLSLIARTTHSASILM